LLVAVDAAQLEWRCAAWLSNDEVALREINSGADTHSLNQEAFNLPSRLISKIYLFRTIFRGSGYAFAHDPSFSHVSSSPDFWDDINCKFYNKYSGLDRWHTSLAQLSASRQPIQGPTGREWLILPDDKGKLKWSTFTNYPVQGTGADLVAIARVSLRNRLSAKGTMALPVSTVHDSIVWDCPDSEVPVVAQTMVDVFNDLPLNFNKLFKQKLPCPFPGEVKIGKNLSEMEKYIV
jgi:DNA polymerase-1